MYWVILWQSVLGIVCVLSGGMATFLCRVCVMCIGVATKYMYDVCNV